MTRRVCTEPGCPTITDRTRCPAHARAKDKARGSRQQRGYDTSHDQLRAAWQRRIDAGEHITCWRPTCGQPITGRAWHLGHLDDRSGYGGPECITCNLSAAGKARHGLGAQP